MSSEPLVTPEDVRKELGGISPSKIDDDLIMYHIGRAEHEQTFPPRASRDDRAGAVAIAAAIRVITSRRETFRKSFTEMDVQEATDVETYIEELRDRLDTALSKAGKGSSPRLYTLGGRAGRGRRRGSRRFR